MTIEMGAEQVTYGRPAADAFDLPAALAARERSAAERRNTSRTGGSDAARVATDQAPATDELPPEFVPWSDR
jgi:hypothetical protein